MIPARLEEMEAERALKATAFEGQKTRVADLEKQKRDREGEVAMSEARLKEFESKLSQIKTNHDYQLALKEIAETKKSNKAIEDQILDIMRELETFEKSRVDANSIYQAFVEVTNKEKEDLTADENRLRSQASALEQSRGQLLAMIEAPLLAQYQRSRRARVDAVSSVQSGVCGGCNMKIPPQLYIEIQRLLTVHSCPSCHRILCLPQWQEELTKKEVAL